MWIWLGPVIAGVSVLLIAGVVLAAFLIIRHRRRQRNGGAATSSPRDKVLPVIAPAAAAQQTRNTTTKMDNSTNRNVDFDDNSSRGSAVDGETMVCESLLVLCHGFIFDFTHHSLALLPLFCT